MRPSGLSEVRARSADSLTCHTTAGRGRQLAVADRIILNKVDLVTPEKLAEVRGAIR